MNICDSLFLWFLQVIILKLRVFQFVLRPTYGKVSIAVHRFGKSGTTCFICAFRQVILYNPFLHSYLPIPFLPFGTRGIHCRLPAISSAADLANVRTVFVFYNTAFQGSLPTKMFASTTILTCLWNSAHKCLLKVVICIISNRLSQK